MQLGISRAELSRRRFVAVATAVGTSGSGVFDAVADEGQPSAGRGQPSYPAGAIDCHVHVLDPAHFPYVADRSYSPGPATLADLHAFHARLGVTRTVLVQPSVYGADNRCMLAALADLGPAVARGVAVVDAATVTDDELRALQRAGVVGLRVNLTVKSEERARAAVDAVSRTIARAAVYGFAVQVYVDLPLVAALADTIAASPVPVVLDHFGGARANGGLTQPGFDVLRRLLASGHVWVKLSAPYRVSTAHYLDVEPIARALVGANPDRLVWASDWPHTGGGAERRERKVSDVEPFRVVDDDRDLALLARWTGDLDTRNRVLVDNAARLFRF